MPLHRIGIGQVCCQLGLLARGAGESSSTSEVKHCCGAGDSCRTKVRGQPGRADVRRNGSFPCPVVAVVGGRAGPRERGAMLLQRRLTHDAVPGEKRPVLSQQARSISTELR